MREFYESGRENFGGHFGEEGLESEMNEDLVTAVGEKFAEVKNSITNDALLEDLENFFGIVENYYDNAYNQEDWDELLRSVQGVLERIEDGDEDAAEAAWEDVKSELERVRAKA